MLCDGRMVCGCADPYGKRVLGDARHASVHGDLDRRDASPALRARSERRRLEVLRRLPAEAAAEEGRDAAVARRSTPAPLPSRLYIECTAACNISCAAGLLRAGNRHHPHPPGRHARLRPVPPRRRRSRAVARSHRLLQLRRGVPAQARGRDVRVHQGALPAHLPLHQHQRPGATEDAGAAAGALGHRRGHVLDRRRDAGELRRSTASAATSTWRSRTCARWPTRSGAPAATCRSSTGATSCSTGTTATRRWTRRAAAGRRDRRRSPVLGDHRSSRGRVLAPLRARHAGRSTRSGTRSGTTTTSATPSPARRRARGSTCATLRARRCRSIARAGRPLQRPHARPQPVDAPVPGAGDLRPPPRPPRRAALRTPTARSSTATSRAPGCRRRSAPGDACDVADRRSRRREQPGRYALKFDLVSEGIDWFEALRLADDDARRCW